MKIMPFFSIILPTYNRALMLQLAVESVIKQTFADWELIIVDDGSTDDTAAVIQKYLLDKRIQYFYQINQERSIARNNGITAATGKYICFLDSDDYYLPTHLATFYEAINETNKLAFFTNCYVECGAEKIVQPPVITQNVNNVEFVFVNSITSQAVCLHRSLLLENKYNPRIRIGEDRELWVRIAKKTSFFYINKHTFVLRDHANRSINTINPWACREGLKTMKKICSENKMFISKSIRNQFLAIEYYNSSKNSINNNQTLKTLKFLLLVLLHKPNRGKDVLSCIKYLALKRHKNYD